MQTLYFKGVPGYEDFVKVEPLDKGLSSDKKYYIETRDNRRLCLRISDAEAYERKKAKYDMMVRVAALGVPMSKPMGFGICNDGKSVYQLLSWCDGENLEDILPTLSEAEQYAIGVKSGEILRTIHSLPAPKTAADWHDRYTGVLNERIQAFLDSGVRFDGWEIIMQYYENNLHLLKGRPQSYLHGDFHAGNLLLSGKELSVIDWELLDFDGYGDPWTDFRSDICTVSPHYITGQIRGYWGGEPPTDFWPLFTFYIAAGEITAIPWAYYMYKDLLDSIIERNINVLRRFDNMKNPVPTWYLRHYDAKS